MSALFPGFQARRIRTAGAEIHLVCGGSGPPVLLLHGYPQTHVMWHMVAPRLAAEFTVVCADLRGYGDSSKPGRVPEHANYSKRAVAQDMVEVMQTLGHERFAVVGHDRGGRVGHRLARDHRARVSRLAVLDISPTLTMFRRTDQAFATAYYHWFFLAQPHDLPERMIGADPVFFLRNRMGAASGTATHFTPEALAQYERCFANPATIEASCEDYRAAATIDLEHDAIDLHDPITCPVLALWGEKGFVHRYFKPLEDWREVATDVRGQPLPCGHYLPEEAPEETLAQLQAFLAP